VEKKEKKKMQLKQSQLKCDIKFQQRVATSEEKKKERSRPEKNDWPGFENDL